jgi:hypothetical protein
MQNPNSPYSSPNDMNRGYSDRGDSSNAPGDDVSANLDKGRATAAGGLDSAASAVTDAADASGETIARGAHKVADALNTTAGYIRENDFKSMMSDAQEMVKKNPGPALLAATALGFLIARSFSRD